MFDDVFTDVFDDVFDEFMHLLKNGHATKIVCDKPDLSKKYIQAAREYNVEYEEHYNSTYPEEKITKLQELGYILPEW